MDNGQSHRESRFEGVKRNYRRRGNYILGISCIIANIVDPLLCYALVIDEEKKCISFDKKLRIIATTLSLSIDFFYFLCVIFNLRKVWSNGAAAPGVGPRKRHYFYHYILADFFTILPLSPVMIGFVIPSLKGYRLMEAIRATKFILLLQYVARILRVHSFVNKVSRKSSFLTDSTESIALLNLVMYLISGHVIGGFWYLFSIERKATCWQENFRNQLIDYSLNCNYGPDVRLLTPASSCSLNPSSSTNTATDFDFGIFADAFKYDVVNTHSFLRKISFCYWWGLQAISSLGQVLQTSKHLWEIYFAIVITISGMVLFAIFIGNMQAYLQARTSRTEQREVITIRHKVHDWMLNHSLPLDLKCQILLYEHGINGVDLLTLLNNLPTDVKRDLTRHFCSHRFRAVPAFQDYSVDQLNSICDLLKPMIYRYPDMIIKEGERLDKIIFIIKGQLRITSSSSSSTAEQIIRLGEYYGDALLNVINQNPSSFVTPTSSENVTALIHVEAFVLMANDFHNFCLTSRSI